MENEVKETSEAVKRIDISASTHAHLQHHWRTRARIHSHRPSCRHHPRPSTVAQQQRHTITNRTTRARSCNGRRRDTDLDANDLKHSQCSDWECGWGVGMLGLWLLRDVSVTISVPSQLRKKDQSG